MDKTKLLIQWCKNKDELKSKLGDSFSRIVWSEQLLNTTKRNIMKDVVSHPSYSKFNNNIKPNKQKSDSVWDMIKTSSNIEELYENISKKANCLMTNSQETKEKYKKELLKEVQSHPEFLKHFPS